MTIDRDSLNLPNLVSSIRILIAPLLIYLAIQQQEFWYIVVLLFSGFTDVLDGFLARTLNQITKLGSHLDSWGDFTIYTTMALCAWILWPQIVLQEIVFFSMILASIGLPVLVGLIKFKSLTSYHTWSVKIAVALTFLGYILLFTGITEWPFRLAAMVALYAGIEEILITLIMSHERMDVRSVWAASKYEHKDKASSKG
ncbi:MAG: CDP-alcohol phosphatidyltransferase family protein [Gammaproteobacteria bacterium]|nr:CDP-alcohol phosphatidyltransferase family protein [Gammaproteobacteria bacterium]